MSEQELTRWFTNGENPWEPGVYERRAKQVGQYSYWNGWYWCLGAHHIRAAADEDAKAKPSSCQDAPWRGLAHPPKAKP